MFEEDLNNNSTYPLLMKNKILLFLFMILFVFLITGCTETVEQTSIESTEKINELGTVKSFVIIAKRFEFIPNNIQVNKGDRIILEITSEDVIHGFSIDKYGINEKIEPGETTIVEFVADKVGTFTFQCSIFCGSGHGGMIGNLIVE